MTLWLSVLTATSATYKGYSYYISGDTAIISYCTDSLRQAGGDLEVPGYIPHNGVMYHTFVGREAFKRCAWINNVTLQYGCLGVGMGGFGFCNNIVTFKVPATVKVLDSNYLSVDNSLGKTANVVYTGLTIPDELADAFRSTYYTRYTVASKAAENLIKSRTPDVNVTFNPYEAFDYTIGGNYYVITKTATAAGNGESALVAANDPAITVHPNSYRHTDYDATLNPVSYNCTSVPDSAFAGSAVESFSWPRASRLEALTSIGKNAFRNCSKLTAIDVSCDEIGEDAFYECKALTDLTLEEGVEKIGVRAFWYCPLKPGLTLPASLSSLEGRSINTRYGKDDYSRYGGMSLGAITDNYKRSSSRSGCGGPFAFCTNLEKYYVADGSQYFAAVDGILYDADKNMLVSCPTNYQTVKPDIPKSVVTIAGGAFANIASSKLAILDFPYGVKYYGKYWAARSRYIEYIHIPSSAQKFEVFAYGEFCDAYNKNTNLKQVVTGVMEPGLLGDAYYWPSSIDLVVPASIHRWYADRGYYAYLTDREHDFRDLDVQLGGYDVVVDGIPYLLTEATATQSASARVCRGKFHQLDWTANMSGTVTIPETIEYGGTTYTVNAVDMQAFAGNTAITGINLPSTVTDLIGANGSYDDSDLDGAQFRGCSLLKSVKLSPNIKAIPNNCFEGTNVKSIKLPWGVEDIGNNAFKGCSLDTLLVPSSIKTWSTNAFAGITKLTYFLFNKPFDADNVRFQATDFGSTSPTLFYVANGSSSTYYNTGTQWSNMEPINGAYDFAEPLRQFTVNTNGKSVTYDYFVHNPIETDENKDVIYNINGHPTATDEYDREFPITRIGYRTFRDANYTVVLSDNITDIANDAFERCFFTSMSLPASVKTIGDNAFSQTSITDLTAEMTQLPKLGTDVFYQTSTRCTLNVPNAMLNTYKNAQQWRDFYKIEGGSNHYTLPVSIAGHQLSEDDDFEALCDSLVDAGAMEVGGIIIYDYRTNTLTLTDVDLTVNNVQGAIVYNPTTGNVADLPETLTIISDNSKLTNQRTYGLYVNGGKALLKGDLEVVSGQIGGELRIGLNTTFELAAGASLTAEGAHYGIYGGGNTSALIIGRDNKGENAIIKAKGSRGAIESVNDSQLLNGYDVVSPAGATFTNGRVVDYLGNNATDTWVTITQANIPVRICGGQIASNWTDEQWDEINDIFKQGGVLNEDGRISYDYDTKTMTFDNVHFTFNQTTKAFIANGWYDESQNIDEAGLDGFTLKIVGDCSITIQGSNNNGNNLFFMNNAGMKIEGDEDATLTLNHEDCIVNDFAFYGDQKNFVELVFNGPSVTSNGCKYHVVTLSDSPNSNHNVRYNYGTHEINLTNYRPFVDCNVSLNVSPEMNVLQPVGAKFVKVGDNYRDLLVDVSGAIITGGTVVIGEGTSLLVGDVNGDGYVNGADVTTLYEILLTQ